MCPGGARLLGLAPGGPEAVAVPEPQDACDDEEDDLVDGAGDGGGPEGGEAPEPAGDAAVPEEEPDGAEDAMHLFSVIAGSGTSPLRITISLQIAP